MSHSDTPCPYCLNAAEIGDGVKSTSCHICGAVEMAPDEQIAAVSGAGNATPEEARTGWWRG